MREVDTGDYVLEMIHNGMSKTALLAVSRGYAKEAAGTGVTVNAVIAAPTHTAGVEDFVYQSGGRRPALGPGAARVQAPATDRSHCCND